MESLFGVSLDLIMWVLVALLAFALATIAYVWLRNPIMFKVGVRNIPRRRAQTILIVLGLMLSTLIISAAFTTGDTVNRSITSEIYRLLGSVDQTIQPTQVDDAAVFAESAEAVAREQSLPQAHANDLRTLLGDQPLIDAIVPLYSGVAAAVHPENQLGAPLFTLVGLDPAATRNLPDLEDLRGNRHRVEDLGPGEIFINRSAAEDLNAAVGDTIDVYVRGRPESYRVRAILVDRQLTGATGVSVRREGGVLPLATVQRLFEAEGQITQIVVSNKGGFRDGLQHSPEVTEALREAVRALPREQRLSVFPAKQAGVRIAERGANFMTTFFLVLGLFSIGAGVLLIFMIFVMLAAERKPEMGMARAVGTKRADLVQTFVSEGMAYNVMAAMVGTGMGVVVAIAIAEIMASVFSNFDIQIATYVTPRSLVISYSLGVVLTFLTVAFSSWRISNINIVRAVRDIPDPPPRRPQWRAPDYTVTVRVREPAGGHDRVLVLARALLVLPVVLATLLTRLVLAALVFPSWLSIVVLGRQPATLWRAARSVIELEARLLAFASLTTDEWPLAPGRAAFVEVEPPARRNRLLALVRPLLLAPHGVAFLLTLPVFAACWAAAWLFLVVSGNLPPGLRGFLLSYTRWLIHTDSFVALLRDEFPPFPPELGMVFKPGSGRSWVARVGLLVVAVILMTSTGVANSGLVQALVGTAGGLVFIAFIFLTFQFGPLLCAASVPLIVVGSSSGQAFPLLMGLSFLPLGLALLVRSFGASERATYTAAGLLLLYIWLVDFETGWIESIFGRAEGNIEMFFLSGVMITVAATFIVVYNADLLLNLLSRVGGLLGYLLPSIKMAVAYPLSSRMRTGLTMSMFCLVVFALIVMSTMNHNFSRVFLSERALGGWDIIVDENPANPIDDLAARLRAEGSHAPDFFRAVGVTSVASRQRARLCQPDASGGGCVFTEQRRLNGYVVRGQDRSFLANQEIPLQQRARGYDSDAAVWSAVAADPTLAVIDPNALAGEGGFGDEGFIRGVNTRSAELDPITLVVYDRTTAAYREVSVIGIIELGASASFQGLHISQDAFQASFGLPDLRRYYVKTTAGADNREVARMIESALLSAGVQAESLRYIVDRQSGVFTSFFRLIQGFMGLGLFVGVAAVGVIAYRTVVERRQQIGMLRALGYTRAMIGLTFVLESAFIALAGVLSGIVFALWLARQIITQELSNQGIRSFSVPWEQVLVIGALAFGSALIMTLLPARQASSIPIAQALRYE